MVIEDGFCIGTVRANMGLLIKNILNLLITNDLQI